MSLFGSFFGQETKEYTLSEANSIVSMVTAAASLASSTKDIDPMLDKLRDVTARLEPGQEPSAADNSALLQVYMQIEDYLTKNDPVRTFKKQDLRSRLQEPLLKQLQAYESKGATAHA